MRLIYNDALNKRIAPYLERLTKKRTSLDKETMAVGCIYAILQHGYPVWCIQR
jgi:glycerol-3-phosphate acyltransferase PlsY